MQLVDREQAQHVDAALETMKQSLQVLREPSQVGSYSSWNNYAVLLLIDDFFLLEFISKFSESPHRSDAIHHETLMVFCFEMMISGENLSKHRSMSVSLLSTLTLNA